MTVYLEVKTKHSEPVAIPRVKVADLFSTVEGERDRSSQEQTSSQVLKTI